MILFFFIFQCFCFMKNPGRFEINLNTEKKISKFSVLTVLPNCHFYVDMHKHCSFKQYFASQSFWQYHFPCSASDVKLLNFKALHNITPPCLFPIWCQMHHSGSQETPDVSIPLRISASPLLLCTIPHAWEEIFAGVFWAALWMPWNPSFPPPCSDACRDRANSWAGDVLWLQPRWSHSFVLSPVCIHLFSLLLLLGCAYVPVAVVGERQQSWSNLALANGDTGSPVWGTLLGPGVQHSSSPGCRSRHSSPALLPTCVCGDPAPWAWSHPDLDPLQVTPTKLGKPNFYETVIWNLVSGGENRREYIFFLSLNCF